MHLYPQCSGINSGFSFCKLPHQWKVLIMQTLFSFPPLSQTASSLRKLRPELLFSSKDQDCKSKITVLPSGITGCGLSVLTAEAAALMWLRATCTQRFKKQDKKIEVILCFLSQTLFNLKKWRMIL